MSFAPKTKAFLAAIAVMPNVTRASEAAGIHKSAHYAKLKSNPEYAAAFQETMQIGCDAMSDVAVERATLGSEEPVLYQGALCYPDKWDPKLKEFVVDRQAGPLKLRRIDNRLLEFVLKNRHPEYRERVEHSGELDINILMERLNAGRKLVADEKVKRDTPG
jgi:hypothetical protein